MTESIHVLIVDDDALTRVGVRTVLSSEPDIVIVGEAATARQAIMFVQSVPTDVVLMDIQLPDMDGIVATQRVLAATRNADRPVRVIALTTFNYDEYVFRSLQAGASGFLLKRTPAEDIIETIRAVSRGSALPTATATRELIARFATAGSPPEKRLRVALDEANPTDGRPGRSRT